MSFLIHNHLLRFRGKPQNLTQVVCPMLLQLQQPVRQYWKEVLRIKSFNPKAKQNKIELEDVETMSLRSSVSQAHEGLLSRQSRYRHYVKPWMKRKRAKEVKKYDAMNRIVNNLKRYVQFTNEFNSRNFGDVKKS